MSGLVLATSIFWLNNQDTRLWSKSGSAQFLEEKGYVTAGEDGNTWFISKNNIISNDTWRALDKLDIEYLMLDNQIIVIVSD